MADSGSHSSRSIKLKRLEKAWNNTMTTGPESRRLAQMTEDIKHFIVRSMSDPMENRRFAENFEREKQSKSTDTFSTIANTLGFKHHEGTDYNMELRVIKVIMIREGILMSLKHSASLAEQQGNLQGNNMLELMSQLRESTLNFLEYLCLWRQSAQSETGEMQPRPFMWENQNYTMRLISDLDFLSENPVVIDCLNLTQEQLRSNPLMLSNNLEDFNTWMAPEERASVDVNGNTNSPDFQTRLRLRYAERILLQEMELYNFEGSQVFMTQDGENQPNPSNIMGAHNPQSQNVMVGSNVLENEYDYDPNIMNGQENPEFAAMMRQRGQDPANDAYFSPERRVKTTEGSNRSSDFSQPQSRASTINNGFVSAPSTSHGSRGGRMMNSQGLPVSSANNGMMPMDYGHDYFTGNWGEGNNNNNSSDAFPFFSEVSLTQEESQQRLPPPRNRNPVDLDDDEDGDEEVLYTENAQSQVFESYTPMNDAFPYRHGGIAEQDDDGQHSAASVESVSEVDMRILSTLFVPPKVVNLAGSVSVILLSKGNEIPMDATWSTFLRLMKRPGFVESMNLLHPNRVPRFKLLAVQPMLEQIFFDEKANHEEYSRKQMSFQELIAVTKLMNWIRQFSQDEANAVGVNNQDHDKNAKKKSKKGKRKQLTSPFKMPPGALAPLQQSVSQASGSHHSGSAGARKRSVSPMQIPTGEQNLAAKEKMKVSRVKEKTALVQLARKQAEEKERKAKEGTKKGPSSKTSSANGAPGATKNKKQIPKVQLDIVPFHHETLDNIYIHPILVVLLTSPDALDIAPPSPKGRKRKSNNNGDDADEGLYDSEEDEDYENEYLENSDEENKKDSEARKDDNASVESIKYIVPSIPKTSGEQTRLVIKAYDSTDSKEAMTYINMREYQLFLKDLPEKLTAPAEEVQMFFQPFDLRWWSENVSKVVAINTSGGAGNKSLKVTISKQKIEEHVRMQIVNLHRVPASAGRRQSVAPRRTIIAPNSAGTHNGSVSSKDSSLNSGSNNNMNNSKEILKSKVEAVPVAGPDTKAVEDVIVPIKEEDEVRDDESLAYDEDFEAVSKPPTAAPAPAPTAAPDVPIAATIDTTTTSNNESIKKPEEEPPKLNESSQVDYLEDSFEGDQTATIPAVQTLASQEREETTNPYVSSSTNDNHHLEMGSMMESPPSEPVNVSSSQPVPTHDDSSIEDNFPELKPPSRITSTRTSVDMDAIQRQLSAHHQQPTSPGAGESSLYGSDFEPHELLTEMDGKDTLLPASPLVTSDKNANTDANNNNETGLDNSLLFEVSNNTLGISTVPTSSAVPVSEKKYKNVSEEEEEEDDGIYDDDLSETAQAPIDRSMSMSASMRMSASFNHGTANSNPASSTKPPMAASSSAGALEPEEDDHSLYNIPDDE